MNTINLQFLVDHSNLTDKQICDAVRINTITFKKYLNGTVVPRSDTLIRIADLFAVPLDYICGRCTKEECDAIEENFADNFRILRRNEYENTVLRFCKSVRISKGWHGPYPYNLLDAIFGKAFDHVLNEDEENGLNEALASLSEREQQVIMAYYKDEKSLHDVGVTFNVGQERIRQIVAKAIRKMRHPSRINRIRYGAKGNERLLELNRKEAELRSREQIVEEAEKILETRLNKKQEKIEELSNDTYNLLCNSQAYFDELDFSTRIYNCLRRSGIDTVDELLEAIRTPDKYHIHDSKLMHIRNLGRKSYEEIVNKAEAITGCDLTAYRNGFDIFDHNGKLIRKSA